MPITAEELAQIEARNEADADTWSCSHCNGTGCDDPSECPYQDSGGKVKDIRRLAGVVRDLSKALAAERERCAKVARDYDGPEGDAHDVSTAIAERILAGT